MLTKYLIYEVWVIVPKDLIKLDSGPMPQFAWPCWGIIESLVKVEAAKGVPYCRPIPGAAKLFLWFTPAAEEEDYGVMYSIESLH
jgi:hypothetical protein